MFKIFIISGSLGNPSHTIGGLNSVKTKLIENNCQVTLWDLQNSPLPFADPKYHKNPIENPDGLVKRFVELASGSDAFVWGSPLYHNSYSGVLKNALDHLSMKEFREKPIGLLSNGGGIRNVQALDHMRIVARGLLGIAIPVQVATSDSDYILNEDTQYVLKNEQILFRIEQFSNQLISYCEKFSKTGYKNESKTFSSK